jgi:hypothetical protein
MNFFRKVFQRNHWLDRCRHRNYEWYPGEIDTVLWYNIIDTFGLPSWIRKHTVQSAQPVFSSMADASEHGGFTRRYGPITSECMCIVTHAEWIPIARFHWQIDRAKHTRLQNDQCLDQFYGYHAEDLKKHLLVRPEEEISYFTGNALGRTIISHIPTDLLV